MTDDPVRLDRRAVALQLREMARLITLAGDEPFKARAYERGASVVERLDADLGELVDRRRLTSLRGVGPALAGVIADLHLTGRSPVIEKLRRQLPAGAPELSRVPGLGLKTIAALNAALGVETVPDLKAACLAGRVRSIKGLGEKTERRILSGILALESAATTSMRIDQVLDIAELLVAHLRDAPGTGAIDVAGGARRWTETVDELAIVLASPTPEAALRHALASSLVETGTGIEHGGGRARAILVNGLPLELTAVAPEDHAAALVWATGSRAHVEELKRVAKAQGMTLDERGLLHARRGDRIATAREADLYRALGLPLIPPELREGDGEISAGRSGALPDDLVRVDDLRGAVHCHTRYSDGKHTVEQMARAAEALGMRYLTITDHSPTASYAGGLATDRLRVQWEEIARVQEQVSVKLLRGTESDILADGALDYPDAILEQLDVVIASVHARHRMDAREMTRRLVRAMKHPCFKIWGHPLGRLVLSRPPIECRVEEVLDALAASRGAVEINGDPRRLDMEPRWLRAARERAIPFVVSSDAHSVGDLANARYGVAMARRGWVRRMEVLNTRGAEAFARAVSPSVHA